MTMANADWTLFVPADEITPAPGWEYRFDELEDRLAYAGLELRTDSRMCTRFVMDDIGDAWEVTAAMIEMHWFWRKTGYRRALRVVEREAEPFELDRDEASLMAKKRALRWLIHDNDEATLSSAPQTLWPEINEAWKIVNRASRVYVH